MSFATLYLSYHAQDVIWVWVGLHHGLAIESVNIVNCQLTTYTVIMIKTIRHRGLRRLYEDNDSSGVLSQYVAKIRRILLALDNAEDIRALDLPGFRLHPLKGDLVGFWSVTVSGNWRIIFRFEQGDAFDVDLVDYH